MKTIPSALQSQSGARGPSSWSRNPCTRCAEDTLHRHGRCQHCGTALPVGPIKFEHAIRGRRK